MRGLDVFCGAGGCSKGYVDAGFDMVGVDSAPMPRYPYKFIQADAFDVLNDREFLRGFDFIHASPPCQDHSPLSALVGSHDTGWMLQATRDALQASGVPYVVENVAGARMPTSMLLCGSMFGLRVYRHRRFEISLDAGMLGVPEHPKHVAKTATKHRVVRWAEGWNISITGDVGTWMGPEAMGIGWMTGDELSQAIPPAYTEFIGQQLLQTVLPNV